MTMNSFFQSLLNNSPVLIALFALFYLIKQQGFKMDQGFNNVDKEFRIIKLEMKLQHREIKQQHREIKSIRKKLKSKTKQHNL